MVSICPSEQYSTDGTFVVETSRFEKVEVRSVTELHEWLLANHQQQDSVWLVTWKKSSGDRYVSRSDVLDELLCFGWIDGIARKLDDDRTMQLISPRRVRHWARSYKERVAILTAAGRLHESGVRSVEDGKKSGLWDFMDDVDDLILPGDLAVALADIPRAATYFANIPAASKRFTLRWLKLSKTEQTRAQRVVRIVQLSARQERLPGS